MYFPWKTYSGFDFHRLIANIRHSPKKNQETFLFPLVLIRNVQKMDPAHIVPVKT